VSPSASHSHWVSHVTRSRSLFRRLCADDRGQDLVEYGLLAAIIGVTSLIAYTSIPGKMETAFKTWGSQVYDLWVPDDPVSAP